MRLLSFSNIPSAESQKNWQFLKHFCFFMSYIFKQNSDYCWGCGLFPTFPHNHKKNSIFGVFLFFHVMHIKQNSDYHSGFGSFPIFPQNHKKKLIKVNQLFNPKNSFCIDKCFFGNFWSISVFYVTHIKQNSDWLDGCLYKKKIFGLPSIFSLCWK